MGAILSLFKPSMANREAFRQNDFKGDRNINHFNNSQSKINNQLQFALQESTSKIQVAPLADEVQINNTLEHQTDINQTLEEQKSQSFVYQLLLAIARQNKHSKQVIGLSEPNHQDDESFKITIESSRSATVNFTLTAQQTETSEINISLSQLNNSLSISQATNETLSLEINNATPQKSDPLIINLNNSDFSFTSNQIIKFDLNADGKTDNFSNLSNGNYFLAMDKNNNGSIDNGSELFGDALGASDGFADLSQYDSNHDHQIDARDQIFKSLLLLSFDMNNQQHLSDISSQHIQSIQLDSQIATKNYANNQLILKSSFERQDGSSGIIGDFLLTLS